MRINTKQPPEIHSVYMGQQVIDRVYLGNDTWYIVLHTQELGGAA